MGLGRFNDSQSWRRKLLEEIVDENHFEGCLHRTFTCRFHMVDLGRVGYLTALRKPRIFASVIAFLRCVSAVLYIARFTARFPERKAVSSSENLPKTPHRTAGPLSCSTNERPFSSHKTDYFRAPPSGGETSFPDPRSLAVDEMRFASSYQLTIASTDRIPAF
jgi:hypothetical protein